MLQAFLDGGTMMWPLSLIGLGVLWITASTARRLARGQGAAMDVRRSLQALLFWGGMSVVLGMLGTVVGWIVASRAIAAAGGVEPRLLWSGLGVTLYTFTYGLVIFAFAALSWFVLRRWESRTVGGASGGVPA